MVRMDADIDLRSGHLVPVLPDWTLPTLRLWAVTPQRDGKPAKVRHAIAALERHLMDQPGTRPV
jgi:DNA-binding transcriptional LysR family regulator